MTPNDFIERSRHWLVHSTIREPTGEVYSWTNPKKPGYVYPEIMGYYLKFLAYSSHALGQRKFLSVGKATAEKIASITPSGIGRDGTTYAFDAAMCLSGMIAFSKEMETHAYDKAIRSLAEFLSTSLSEKIVAFSGNRPLIDQDKWSLSFGASSLKTCIALLEASDYIGDANYRILAERISKEIVSTCFVDGHFTINAQRKWVYTHPHCYAVEGLLYMQSRGYNVSNVINQAADWLASVQNDDGSLYDWYFRTVPRHKQGDATSQAIRIWTLTDKKKYEKNIENAFSFLRSLQSPSGGLSYQDGSEDINSWVTMFSCQAAEWLLGKGDARWLI